MRRLTYTSLAVMMAGQMATPGLAQSQTQLRDTAQDNAALASQVKALAQQVDALTRIVAGLCGDPTNNSKPVCIAMAAPSPGQAPLSPPTEPGKALADARKPYDRRVAATMNAALPDAIGKAGAAGAVVPPAPKGAEVTTGSADKASGETPATQNPKTGWHAGVDTAKSQASLTLLLNSGKANGALIDSVTSLSVQVPLPKSDAMTKLSAIDTLLPNKSITLRQTFVLNAASQARILDKVDASLKENVKLDQNNEGICLLEAGALAQIIIEYGLDPKISQLADFETIAPATDASAKALFSDDLANSGPYGNIIRYLASQNQDTGNKALDFASCQIKINENLGRAINALTATAKPASAKAVSEAVKKVLDDTKSANAAAATTEMPARAFFTPVAAVSFDATLGYTKYSFFDPTTLAPGSHTPLGYAIGTDLTYLWRPEVSISTGYHHQVAYEAGSASSGKETTICLNATTAALTCAAGYFGAPTRQVAEIVDIEARWAPTLFKHRIGFAPRLDYDWKSGVYKVTAPVFLFTGGSGSRLLNGGVEVIWTSDKGAAFGIIFNTGLCIFSLGTCDGG